MSLTKEQLLKMDEATLQQEVLMGLFTKMGFQDVHLHRGTTEFGKDLVMWEEGNFGERINHAVVVKAKKITGSASSSAGAGTVATQIQQCFGKNYLDHVTTEELRINHVYVVNSHEIPKEAIEAVKSIINNQNIDRATTFIDGEKLWEYIEKYLPERLVIAQLHQVNKIFNEIDPHWRINSITSSEGIKLSIEPKTPEALEQHPIGIKGEFNFPDTPEGQAKRKEYEDFVDTGSKMTIPNEFVEHLDIPEPFRKLIEPLKNVEWQISTESQPDPDKVVIVKIEIKCNDGEVATLDYIALLPVQSGRKQIILSNPYQKVPWRIELVLKYDNPKIKFNIELDIKDINVKRMLEGWKFLRAVSKGGDFRIEHLDTGFHFFHQKAKPRPFELPLPFWFELLEKLVFIQSKTKTPIVFPQRSISPEEIKTIFKTAAIIEKGQATSESITLTGVKGLGKVILDHFASGKPFFLRDTREEEVKILGTTIPIGTVEITIHNGYLSEKDLEELKQAVEKCTSEEDTLSVSFKSYPDRPITVKYINWLSQNETSEEKRINPKNSKKRSKPKRRR